MFLNEIPVEADVVLNVSISNKQSVDIKTKIRKSSDARLEDGTCAVCVDAIKRGSSFINLNGSKLTLRYTSEEDNRDYFFKINNSSINKSSDQHILFSNTDARPANRREYVRITLVEKAVIRMKGSAYNGYTVDISNTGVQLSTEIVTMPVEIGDKLTCEFSYSVTGNSYKLQCIVRHVEFNEEGRKPILKIGCEISDTNNANMTTLISHVQRNELRKLKKY